VHTTGDIVYSSPSVVDRIVFIGSGDNRVYALNATTGAEIWNYTAVTDVDSSPAVIDNVVYIGAGDTDGNGKLYALNKTTGTEIWNYTSPEGGIYFTVASSPAVVGDKVFVLAWGEWGSIMIALNKTTGADIWSQTFPDSVDSWSSPAVAGNMVYIGAYDEKVHALNATTGAEIWNYTTGDDIPATPLIVDDLVIIGSYDYKIYALNKNTGAHIWNYTTEGDIGSSAAVDDDMVFVGSDDGKLYALNKTTGELIWNYTTRGGIWSSPAVTTSTIFIGSDDDRLYALNKTTGSLIQSCITRDDVRSSPAVADGKVFVGSFDGKVYAFSDTINPPASVSNLSNTTYAETYINWTWTNPYDADFNHTMIFINGTFQTNLSGSINYYNFTTPFPGTKYKIDILTVDLCGNINLTSVNYTAITAGEDTIPPFTIINLKNTTGETWINWTWDNPADTDFNYTMIYINSSFAENVTLNYYNLTNLLPNTSHTISTRTVDTAGNINETWVNQTTFTLAQVPELSASAVSSSQIDLSWKSDNPDGTFYELFEDSEMIYSGTSTFFNHTGLSPSTTYHYKLRAKNGAGVYTENSSAEATTKSAIICGDGRCEGEETCSSCPQDCGRCPSGRKAYCGDGKCDSGETCSSCPDDCGVCPTPTPEPTPTPPLPANVSILIKKDVGSLQAGESRVVSFEESDIWEIQINVRNAVSNISIEIQQFIKKPNVSDAPGISYRYLNITAGNLTEEDLENATIRFRVNLSWIAENEIDEEKIALQRYNESRENWEKLPTEMIGEENESMLYETVSPGFSIFAITGEMKIEPLSPPPTLTPPVTPPEVIVPTTPVVPETPAPKPKPFPGFEIIVAFLALLIFILRKNSKSM
jgi:PGF-pre-PGF domain-containing protein